MYEVVGEHAMPENRDSRSDRVIQFTGEKVRTDCPCLLRRVAAWIRPTNANAVLDRNGTEYSC